MDEIFSKVETYLSVFGMNCFTTDKESNYHRGRRYFIYRLGCTFNFLVGFWTCAIEPGLFSIKIIVIIYMVGYFLTIFHNFYFVGNKENFRAMILWVKSLYKPRKHPFVEQESKVQFGKCLKIVQKITKLILVYYISSAVGFCTSPIVTSFRYPAPMEIPFKNRDGWVAIITNYLSQCVILNSVFLFYGIDLALFVTFSMHIIYESYLVGDIVAKFGEKEGHTFISDSLRNTNPKIWQKQEFIKDDFQNEKNILDNSWRSPELIKTVLEMHTRILEQVDALSELYAMSSAMWEILLVEASVANLIMMHISWDMVIVIGPTFFMEASQYFIVSMLSSLIRSANENIAEGIYASKWYWLSVQDKRDIWKILLQAQQPKTFLIGLYRESNLERFADFMKFLYNISIATNVLLG